MSRKGQEMGGVRLNFGFDHRISPKIASTVALTVASTTRCTFAGFCAREFSRN